MEERESIAREAQTASEAEATSHLRRRVPVWARVALGVSAAVLVLAVAFDLTTASPALCGSCHEMQPRHDSWARSAHVGVSCVQCHQTPRPWYALPVRVVDRAALLARDVSVHLSGDFDDPVETRSATAKPIQDVVCLQCHDPDRKATSGFRILIDHVEHAKRNGSCVSCHVRTAHPLETRGTTLTLMAQCFTCHGTAEQPEASAECDVCHPAGFELTPSTHRVARWADTHGAVALEDPALCMMCHEQSLCGDCHGVEMPHPDDWAEGAKEHALEAARAPEVCARCHSDEPDMCTMCHHAPYDPGKGAWVGQHSEQVIESGALYCLDCHSPVDCVECHVR